MKLNIILYVFNIIPVFKSNSLSNEKNIRTYKQRKKKKKKERETKLKTNLQIICFGWGAGQQPTL